MFSFQYGEGALRPYFSQAHHAPVGLTADPFMPSIKSRIATASKNSAPNARLLKAGSVSLAVFAGIPLHLITTQVFSGRLTAVQPLVDKLGTFRTTKCIFLGQIIKTILFRRIGKLDRGNVSGDARQLQTTMNGTGIVATIQCNVLHRNPVLNLPLQMPQNQQTLFFIRWIHIYASYYDIFTVYGRFP